MADGTTAVDFISLEEFHNRLTARVAQAQQLVQTLTNDLVDRNPKLGTFEDADSATSAYWTRWRDQVGRASRLLMAVQAAQTATGEILKTYKTTEQLNSASAQDLAAPLGSVTTALTSPSGTASPSDDGRPGRRYLDD
jgi:hypothetical protein